MSTIMIIYREAALRPMAEALHIRLQMQLSTIRIHTGLARLMRDDRPLQPLLEQAVQEALGILVLIGPRWAEDWGQIASDAANQWVIQAALERQKLVLPLLAEDTPLPSHWPQGLAGLAQLSPLRLSEEPLPDELDTVVAAISPYLDAQPDPNTADTVLEMDYGLNQPPPRPRDPRPTQAADRTRHMSIIEKEPGPKRYVAHTIRTAYLHEAMDDASRVLLTLLPDTRAQILRREGQMMLVRYGDPPVDGWLRSVDVTIEERSASSEVALDEPFVRSYVAYPVREVALLEDPNLESGVLRQVGPTQALDVVNKHGGFYQVRYQTQTGWVVADLVHLEELEVPASHYPNPEPYQVPDTEVPPPENTADTVYSENMRTENLPMMGGGFSEKPPTLPSRPSSQRLRLDKTEIEIDDRPHPPPPPQASLGADRTEIETDVPTQPPPAVTVADDDDMETERLPRLEDALPPHAPPDEDKRDTRQAPLLDTVPTDGNIFPASQSYTDGGTEISPIQQSDRNNSSYTRTAIEISALDEAPPQPQNPSSPMGDQPGYVVGRGPNRPTGYKVQVHKRSFLDKLKGFFGLD